MERMFPSWMEGLPWRAKRGLLLGGYTSRTDVVLATTAELLLVHGIGVKTLRELNAWRRPRTRTECENVAASLASKRTALSLTHEASEICRTILLADPGDDRASQMRLGVLEILYPTIKRRA